MTNAPNFTVYYLCFNMHAVLMFLLSWKRPQLARWVWAGLLLLAACYQSVMGIHTPELFARDFHDHAMLASVPWVADWFLAHVSLAVLQVALVQFLIGIGFLVGGASMLVSRVAAIVLFVGMSMLGAWAAFPATIVMAAGLLLMNPRRTDATAKSPAA